LCLHRDVLGARLRQGITILTLDAMHRNVTSRHVTSRIMRTTIDIDDP
jgi:hypothetical protein